MLNVAQTNNVGWSPTSNAPSGDTHGRVSSDIQSQGQAGGSLPEPSWINGRATVVSS